MAHKQKGLLTTSGEWAKHLRSLPETAILEDGAKGG
jgi:hypothetical protein